MRSLDYMNRVEAYVNRLNSERRTVLETIPQVRFLDLMADEINCADKTADCEEDENKKYGVAPNLDAVHTKGYAKRSLVMEDLGRTRLPWDFCFFCDNHRRDERTHDRLFS